MRVGVEGYGYRCMSEKLLDKFWMYTLQEQEGGACVPEVVESGRLREICSLQEPLKWTAGQRVRAHRLACVAGEHQIVVLPQRS